MHRLIVTVVGMLIVGLALGAVARPAAEASPRGAAQTGCLETTLNQIRDSGVEGSAQLCVDEMGVHPSIDARELTAGEAYTVWFVYIDQPSACSATPCGPDAALGDDPLAVVTRMDGAIADETSQLEFTDQLRDLRFSAESQVHLVIFAHGPASTTDNRMLARQLLTPQALVFGTPGMATVADGDVGHSVAVAVFTIPDGAA